MDLEVAGDHYRPMGPIRNRRGERSTQPVPLKKYNHQDNKDGEGRDDDCGERKLALDGWILDFEQLTCFRDAPSLNARDPR